MNFSKETDYRDLLRSELEARKLEGSTLRSARVADRCRIQRSYFSNVLRKKAHLSADQLFLVSEAMGFDSLATEKILLLMELQRSEVAARKAALEKKWELLAKAKSDIGKRLSKKTVFVDQAGLQNYYSDPCVPIVHMALLIPRFRADPAMIAKKFNMSRERLEKCLRVLREAGILSHEKNGLQIQLAYLHLDDRSDLAKIHAMHFRLRAIEAHQRRNFKTDSFLSTTFASSDKMAIELKAQIYESVRQFSAKLEKSEPQKVFHFNFDLFPV